MKRREFFALIGGAVALPLAARAQQTAMPVIGYLDPRSPEAFANRKRAFSQGLKETGYIEGENLAIEYRWGDNQPDRLPELAADLVRRRAAVIVAVGGAAQPAKAATATTPIVFIAAEDPVKLGLVASLARPGGNLTGINFFNSELAAKRMALLHEMVPAAVRIAVLVNPSGSDAEPTVRDVETAARAMGLQIKVLNASTSQEIDAAFATFLRERPDALFVGSDAFFTARRVQMSVLAARHGVPASYQSRDPVEAGGLMSYGANNAETYRQLGVYVGRVLKGAKPADLPVLQTNKFELVINAQTARTLGLTVPPSLLARADEVIE